VLQDYITDPVDKDTCDSGILCLAFLRYITDEVADKHEWRRLRFKIKNNDIKAVRKIIARELVWGKLSRDIFEYVQEA